MQCVKYAKIQVFSDLFFSSVWTELILSLYVKIRVMLIYHDLKLKLGSYFVKRCVFENMDLIEYGILFIPNSHGFMKSP